MPKTSIIIGLGGTGQTVLTYLKKELMETFGGVIPENVKLLSYDTMPSPDVVAQMAKTGGAPTGMGSTPEFEKAKVGAVSLEDNREFYGLSGDGMGLGMQAVKGDARHISSWFDARHYLQEFGNNAWDLATGAGAVRQFGRLAFFMRAGQEIYNPLQRAFQEAQRYTRGQEEMEVIIVSSFAGGTGAGMFIDMGVICRSLAPIVNNSLVIRGMFVFPRAFISQAELGNKAELMQARSFAAWRELTRFMNIGPVYGSPRMTYIPGNNQLDVEQKFRPYDQVYLIDSKRDLDSLETEPAKGVFPSIADFISTIIDRQSGRIYSEQAINLNSEEKHGYTVFGTYSIKVPIYYAVRDYSLNFTRDLLKLWLQPEFRNDKPIALMPDKNAQAAASQRRGQDAAVPLLQGVNAAGAVFQDPAANPNATQERASTQLFQRIGAIYTDQWKDQGQYLDIDAQGGFSLLNNGYIVSGSYLDLFTTMPSDSPLTKININPSKPMGEPVDLKELQDEIASSVWDKTPPSKLYGDSPAEALERYNHEILPYENEHYGQGNDKGKFGNVLDKARKFQVARYSEVLQHRIQTILNGTSANPKDNMAGKLGYVTDMCDRLVKVMDYFTQYIIAVQERRAKYNLQGSSTDMRNATKDAMISSADRKCFFFFTHPKAHISQREYLRSVDEYHTIRKDDILLGVLAETAKELREVSQKALESAQEWSNHLMLGTTNVPGLYNEMTTDIAENEATRAKDREATRVQKLLEMDPYSQILAADPMIIEAALSRIHWRATGTDSVSLKCFVDVPTLKKNANGEDYFEDVQTEMKCVDDITALDKNKAILSSIGAVHFSNIPDLHHVIKELRALIDPQFSDPERFAKQLLDHSHVLYDPKPGAALNNFERRIYMRIRSKDQNGVTTLTAEQDQYVNTVISWIQQHSQDIITNRNNIVSAGSEDSHSLTIVQIADHVQDEDFAIWDLLQESYKRQILNTPDKNGEDDGSVAARLHVFPAECNAARYEKKMVRLLAHREKKVGYHLLHPRVVMLLENAQRLRLFLRCKAYGYIKSKNQPSGGVVYSLDLPAYTDYMGQKIDFLGILRDQYGSTRMPNTFEILDAFTKIGRDVNTNEQINWINMTESINAKESELRDKVDKKTGVSDLKKILQTEIEKGFVFQMQAKAKELATSRQIENNLRGSSWAPGQDYTDLADVAEMMLLETIKANESDFQVNTIA